MPTFYYHLNEYLICATCSWVCSYEPMDTPTEATQENPATVPQNRIVFCTNLVCTNYLIRYSIPPISVEAQSAAREAVEKFKDLEKAKPLEESEEEPKPEIEEEKESESVEPAKKATRPKLIKKKD